MLTLFFWFIVYFLKYALVSAVLGAIAGYFFPIAGLIVFGLFLLSGVVQAWKEAMAKRRTRSARFEMEGFNQALRSMQRNVTSGDN